MTNQLTKFLDHSIRLVASLLIAAIFLITLAQVVLRYVFSTAIPWSAEAAQVLLVYTVMLVAAYAAGHGSHFTVRSLLEALPSRAQYWLGRFHRILIVSFSIVAIIYGGKLALAQMDGRLPSLGLPVGLVYAALPLGAVLMCIYALVNLAAGLSETKD